MAADGAVSAWSAQVSATVTASASETPTTTSTPTSTQLMTSTPTHTPAAEPELTAPVLVAEPGIDFVRLTWWPVPGAHTFQFIVYDWDASAWQFLDVDPKAAPYYIHLGLTPGITYHYHARAVSRSGAVGPWSQRAFATLPPPTATPTPTPTSTPTPVTTERGALLVLYHATGGDNWNRNLNWLSGAPLSSWDGVLTDSNGRVTALVLNNNNLNGTIPNLRTLTELRTLLLSDNHLTGSLPDLNHLGQAVILDFSNNNFSGPLPDLSELDSLRVLSLNDNRMTGPIHTTDLPPNLAYLLLENNDLIGPVPDLNTFYKLQEVNLTGNRLCMPPNPILSHLNSPVTAYLNSIDPPACTPAELSLVLRAPQNLTASGNSQKVTLRWDAVSNATGYELRWWNSRYNSWGDFGRSDESTTVSRNLPRYQYFHAFQVRALGTDVPHSAWSETALAIIVPQRFPPPPPSLGFELDYWKHLEIVEGVHLVATGNASDNAFVHTSEIYSQMLSTRPDLLEAMSDFGTRIFMDDDKYWIGGKGPLHFTANVPVKDYKCYVRIQVFAEMIQDVIEDQPNGGQFRARLQAQYEASLNAGLWQDQYASSNIYAFWAEIVTFWFMGRVYDYFEPLNYRLESYDPEAAKLVEDVFGDASVPYYC